MTLPAIVFIFLVVAGLVAFLVREPRHRQRKEGHRNQRLNQRPQLSSEQVLQRYYAAGSVPLEAVEIVRRSIASAANIPTPEIVLPCDYLYEDLRPWGFDDLGMVLLVMSLEDAIHEEIPNAEVARFYTVDDLIRYVGRRCRTSVVAAIPTVDLPDST